MKQQQPRKVLKRLYKDISHDTYYGKVMRPDAIDYNGQPISVYYADPRAVLRWLSEECELFGHYLEKVIGLQPNAIVYMDACMPGNALRPDEGRKFEAVYWQFLECPEHMRKRVAAWFPFMYVSTADMKETGCSDSTVIRFLAHKMFLDARLHEVGFHFLAGGVQKRMTIDYGGWLADDLCVWSVGSCKGPSSRKPCPCCKNVLGRIPVEALVGHPYAVHVSSADASRFISTSAADYAQMCDMIEHLYTTNASNAEKEDLEVSCGIKYDPHEAMFDRDVRSLLQFPEKVFWDWQHNLVSSGGVAQYVCNEMARQVVDSGIASLQQIDLFARTITFPIDQPSLGKNFFQDRVKLEAGKHMKAFASETLTTVSVLGLFADEVLGPANALGPYVELLSHMRTVIDLLKLGDEVAMPSRLDLLDREMAALHRQMVALIPECIKLKPHLMRHIIGSIRKYGALWSCFAPERKHRLGKAVANTNFRNPYKSMLAHDIYDLRLTFQDPDIYAPTALLKECRLDGLEDFFKHVINVQSVFGARKVRTPKGTFSVKDVLAFRDNGNMYVAKEG